MPAAQYIGGGYDLAANLPAGFYHRINRKLDSLKVRRAPLRGAIRSIVKSSGRLVTEVALVKARDGYNEVYIDAGRHTAVSDKPRLLSLKNRLQDRLPEKNKCEFYGTLCSRTKLFDMRLDFEIRNEILWNSSTTDRTQSVSAIAGMDTTCLRW